MNLCTDHCIVTFMDLIDVKKIINDDSRRAVELMQNFHQVVYGQINNSMPKHQHAYTWNDSVLLVARIDENLSQYKLIMKEADELKKRIDEVCECYAISVKGMSFSEPCLFAGHQFKGQIDQPKFVFLKSSSYAFSNCFEIEKKLKKHEKSWYLDERIFTKINISKPTLDESVSMLPSGTKRKIYMYDRYLW